MLVSGLTVEAQGAPVPISAASDKAGTPISDEQLFELSAGLERFLGIRSGRRGQR